MKTVNVSGKVPCEFFRWLEVQSGLDFDPEIRQMLACVDLKAAVEDGDESEAGGGR